MDLSQEHISKERIETILSKAYPIKIKNVEIYQRAFVHKSIQKYISDPKEVPKYMCESNERLELVGDSVLGMAVISYLYHRFPNKDEGELTKIKTRIVRGSTLAEIATALGIKGSILMSEQVINLGGVNNSNLLENAIEALIGAIYLDQGYMIAEKFVISILESKIIDHSLFTTDDNYKDILLRYTQGEKLPSPIYETIRETGKPNEKEFTLVVKLYNKIYGKGRASRKKDAEQLAAKDALKELHIGFQ